MPAKTALQPEKILRFRVSKLGALTHGGEFEVKPLTLFCGKNNTGKTWVNYALHKLLNMRDLPSGGPLKDLPSGNIAQKRIKFKKWLEKNWKNALSTSNKASTEGLPALINESKELLNGAKFEWVIDKDTLINGAIYSGWKGMAQAPNGTVIISKEQNAEDIEVVSTGKVNKAFIEKAFPFFSALILSGPAFFVPAERCGLHLFFRELRARRTALLHNVGKSKNLNDLLQDVIRTPYPEPIADYIDWLNTVENKKPSSPFADIAQLVAAKIAGGKYRVDENGNIFFTPNKTNGAKPVEMGLHAASSTVKSMFGLWYYLRHNAKPGYVMMIDEPELNLHPASQRILARLLAQLVNRGLCVVASTHSDYIVREVNILLILNRKDPKQTAKRASLMKKHKISEEETLNPDLLGAYEMSAKSGKIESIKMDGEGIDADTLDDVINAQSEASDEVYFSYPR